MIEINLLPSAQKTRKKAAVSGFPLRLPRSLSSFDRTLAFTLGAWIIGPLAVAWLFFSVHGKLGDAQVALEQAVADSTRYARTIETQERLRARQDTVAQKLAIIQEINAGRYVWPHILDEVSLALPAFTWVTGIYQIEGGTVPAFQIQGLTGSLPALTHFMDALEASPFLRNIELVSSEQVTVGGAKSGKIANNFMLTGHYEQPPSDLIETVSLFPDLTGDDTLTAGTEASHGSGTP